MSNFAKGALAAAAALVMLAGCENGPRQSREYTSSLPAAGLVRLALSGSNGDIHATAANVDRIEIHARITTHAIQGLQGDSVTATRHGDEADIVSRCGEQSVFFYSAQNCEIDYWITYPRSMQASISLANGDITVRGPAASVQARTTNGDVTIDGIAGSVDARSTNGDVEVGNASGDITATSSEGDVSATLAPRWAGHLIAMKTHFGDVSLQVPQDFRATLHLGTVAGTIRGNREIPPGNALVDASTVFGDVTFERN